MVSIFTGLGSGFERGSLAQLGSAGLLGSGALGRAGEQVSLNAATGNLLISQRDEFLAGKGPDASVSRTYNSLGDPAHDDNHDNWQQSTDRRVYGLTGTLNNAGSTVKRLSGDGSEITYTWQTLSRVINGTTVTDTAYFATDGSGSYDKLVQSGSGDTSSWTWTDGDSQVTEIYIAYDTVNPLTPTNWRIASQTDTSGNSLTFTYESTTSPRLSRITTQSNEYISYSWDGSGNLTDVVTHYGTGAGTTLTRVHYGYVSNRLTSATVDLSPEDNSVTDLKVFTTNYDYDSSGRLFRIRETDGSQLDIIYDDSGRVKTLTQTVATGVTRATNIAYGSGYTTITDPLGQVTRLDYDSRDRLTKITAPPATSGANPQVQQFAYDANDNVTDVTDALNASTHYDYDNFGNVLKVTDSLGNFVTRTYSAQNQILTETHTPGGSASTTSENLGPSLYPNYSDWGGNQTGSAGTLSNGAAAYYYTGTSSGITLGSKAIAANAGDTITWELTLKAGTTTNAASIPTGTGTDVAVTIVRGPGSVSLSPGSWAEISGLSTTAETRIRVTRHVTTSESEYLYFLAGASTLSGAERAGLTLIVGDPSIVKTTPPPVENLGPSLYPNYGDWGGNQTGSAGTLSNGAAAYYYTGTSSGITLGSKAIAANAGDTITWELTLKAGTTTNAASIPTGTGTDVAVTIVRGPGSVSLSPGSWAEISGLSTTAETRIRVTRHVTTSESDYLYFLVGASTLSGSDRAGLTLIVGDPSIVKTTPPAMVPAPTIRYAYDDHHRLEYAVSAEGRVTHYSYDTSGNDVADQVYVGGHYDVSALANDAALTSAQITTWASGLGDKTQIHNTARTYDARGNLLSETEYSSDLVTGSADASGGNKLTSYVYDQAGRLLSRTVNGVNAEHFVYDGLGRVIASTDVNGATTSFCFVDSATQTIVIHGNGLEEITTYNKAGEIIAKSDSLDSTNLGPSLYPNYGDWGGNQTGSAGTLSNGAAAYYYTGTSSGITLGSKAIAANAGDTITWELTLKAGTTTNAASIPTGTGTDVAVTIVRGPGSVSLSPGSWAEISGLSTTAETRIRVTRHVTTSESDYLYFLAGASTLSGSDRAGLTLIVGDPSITVSGPVTPRYQYNANGQLRVAIDKANNATYFVYDKAGRKVADVDQYGDMVEYIYDDDDRIVGTVRYANQLSSAQLATVADPTASFDIAAVRPSFTVATTTVAGTNDLRTWKVYDADGRVIEAIDGTGDVTRYSYDGFGRLVATTAYANKLTVTQLGTIIATPPTTAVLPQADAAHDSVSRVFYDKDGLVVGTLNGEGYVTRTDYDDAGQKITETAFGGQVTNATTRASGTLADLVAAASGSGSDRVTRYAYDDQGQLRFVVDALGQVTEYGYRGTTTASEIGDVRTVTRYANLLKGTPVSYTVAGIQAQLDPSAAKDRVSYAVYDLANRLAYAIDASGAVTGYGYDNIGQLIKTTQFATLCTVPSLDLTTMVAWQADPSSASGDDRVTRSYFDRRGRLKYVVDGEGFLTRYDYDAENRVTGTTRWDSAVTVSDATTIATLAEPTTGDHVTTATTYDHDGRVSSTTDGENWITTFSYNANGTLAYSVRASNSATDQVKTSYEYDNAGRVWKRHDAAGTSYETVTVFTYDGLGDVVKVIDALGGETYNYYDRLGRLTTVRDQENYVTQNVYTAFGELASVTRRANPATNTADITILPDFSASAGDAVTYNYYDSLGRVTLSYDAEHHGTKSHYTVLGDLDYVTRYYNRANNAASVSVSTRPTFDPHAKDATTSFEYDKLGRLKKTIDAEVDQNGNPIYEEYTLNAFGQRRSVRNRLNGVTINTYDRRGLLTLEELPISAVRNDGATEAATVLNKFEYDARGNRQKMIEAYGLSEARTTIYKYDKLDRLIETRGDAVADGTTGVSTVPVSKIAYDARGNVVETTDANGARTLSYYDKLGRVIVKVDALGDYTSITYSVVAGVGSRQVTRTYATPITLPVGAGGTAPAAPSGAYRETTSTFDKLGRLTQTDVAGILTGRWTGDPTSGSYATSVGTLTTTFKYDANGNVIKATDANLGAVYTYYDKLGRKLAQVDAPGYLTLYYSKDGAGNIVHALDAEGNVPFETRYATAIGSGFDENTSVATLKSLHDSAASAVGDSGGDDRTTSFTYDRAGRRLTESRANVVAYTINTSSGSLSTPATVTSTIIYHYNALGQVLDKTEANDSAAGPTVAYTYDAGGRLIKEQRASYTDYNGHLATPTVQYYYDGLGNLVRTRQSGDIDATVERITRNTYGAGGRLLSMTDAATSSGVTRSYFYDLAGNKVGESYVRQDSYGATTTEGVGYKYDKLGRLIQQTYNTVSGTTWTQVGDVTNIAYNAYGEVSKRGTGGTVTPIFQQSFDYDAAGHLWRSNANDGVWRYYVTDANGNQTLEIASEGTDLSGKTIDQVIAIARNNGANAIGGAYVDGINATVTTYDKRNQATASIQTQRQLSESATPTSLIQSRAYNAFGEVRSETDARGGITSYAYNTMGRAVSVTHPSVTVMAPNGTTSSATPVDGYYYDVSGRLVATQDANGYITSRVLLAGTGYGDNQALMVQEFHPDGYSIANAYDAYGDLRKATDGAARTTVMDYDADGRLTTQYHPGGSGALVDHYSYDVLGQRILRWNSELGQTNPERTGYDAQGRVVSTLIGGVATMTTYVWSDSVVTTGMTTSANAWGGWTQTTTYANGRTAVEVSDVFNHRVSKTDMGGHVTNFSFDLAGRVTAATLPGAAADSIAYTYLNTGLVSTATSGVYGTSGTFDYRRATYSYDAAGNKLSEGLVHNTTGNSETLQSATAIYDALGRMTSWAEAGNATTPAADETWHYDKAGNIIHLLANYQVIGADGTASGTPIPQEYYYRYDPMNRVTTSQGILSGGAIVRGTQGVDIMYNGAGDRVAALRTKTVSNYVSGYYYTTYNQDTQETYGYSADGTLNTVSVAQNSSTGGALGAALLKSTFTYDAFGRLKRQQDWTGNGLGVALDHQIHYNAQGHIDYEHTDSLQGSDLYTTSVNYSFGEGTADYALGAAISSTSDGLKNNYTLLPNSSVVYKYAWYDGAVQSEIDNSRMNGTDPWPTSTTTYAYTDTGILKSAHVYVPDPGGSTRDVKVTSDGLGQVIRRDEANYKGSGDPHEVWYRFNGKQIGYIGNNGTLDTDYLTSIATRTTANNSSSVFRGGNSVSSANFDQNYNPINSYEQESSGGIYTAQAGDTLASIAGRVWGDSSLWYKLAQYNGLGATSALVEGQIITIPSGVGASQNNAGTNRPYNPSDAYGDTSPTTPQPQAAKKNNCGVFGQILLVIIAVAVTIATHGAAAGFAHTVLGTTGLATTVVGGALSAVAGSVVSQTFGVATGIQESFSWKGVALAAIGGAVGGAFSNVNAFGTASGIAKFGSDVVRGALSSAVTQGIGVATGLQDKFDWAGVAAAGIGAGVGGAVGGRIGFDPNAKGWDFSNAAKGLVANTVGGLANAAARSLINGTDFGDNLIAALPDIVGNAVGSLVGRGIVGGKASSARGNGDEDSGGATNNSENPFGLRRTSAKGGLIRGFDIFGGLESASAIQGQSEDGTSMTTGVNSPLAGAVVHPIVTEDGYDHERGGKWYPDANNLLQFYLEPDPRTVAPIEQETPFKNGEKFALSEIISDISDRLQAADDAVYSAVSPLVESAGEHISNLGSNISSWMHDRFQHLFFPNGIPNASDSRYVWINREYGEPSFATDYSNVVKSAASSWGNTAMAGLQLSKPNVRWAAKGIDVVEDVAVWDRLGTVGRTPGKSSATGRAVIQRMEAEGKIMDDPVLGRMFKGSDEQWYPMEYGDMSHKTDAVSWWNATGRSYGAKAPEVRQWMLKSDNYVIDYYSINRSAGAKLGNSGVRYLPPLK